jgi:pimeloyl-ACP methyl ester carboxylesterase
LPMGADWLAYRGLRLIAPLVIADVDDISPCNAVASMPPRMPVLLLAGEKDPRAPPGDAEAICERCGDQANVVTFAEGEHLQLERSDPQLYRESILGFLDRALRQ